MIFAEPAGVDSRRPVNRGKREEAG
jgi:hypothetical protein